MRVLGLQCKIEGQNASIKSRVRLVSFNVHERWALTSRTWSRERHFLCTDKPGGGGEQGRKASVWSGKVLTPTPSKELLKSVLRGMSRGPERA